MKSKIIVFALFVCAFCSEASAVWDCVTGVENERVGLRVDLDSGILYCTYSRVYYQEDDSQVSDGMTTWTGGFVRMNDYFGLFEFDFYYRRGWGSVDEALSSFQAQGMTYMVASIYHNMYSAFPNFPGRLEFYWRTP